MRSKGHPPNVDPGTGLLFIIIAVLPLLLCGSLFSQSLERDSLLNAAQLRLSQAEAAGDDGARLEG